MEDRAWIGPALRSAAWAPALVVVGYAMVVVVLGAAAPPWLDSVAHLAGGVAMAYFSFATLGHLQRRVGQTPLSMRLLAAVGLTAVAAIAWELLEFLADLSERTRFVPGVEDTLLDLALGVAGAMLFALAVAVTRCSAPSGS